MGPSNSPAQALLLQKGWHLAVAESCTGGLVMKRLTDLPGSSAYLAGGVVAYADHVKIALLGVDPNLLRENGAVSREVARSMALGVATRLGTPVGLSITGIAGPGGAAPGKPVGTVWFGCAVGGASIEERAHFSGVREEIREAAAVYALDLLARVLSGSN